jgi:hypothetical protein
LKESDVFFGFRWYFEKPIKAVNMNPKFLEEDYVSVLDFDMSLPSMSTKDNTLEAVKEANK